MAVQDITKLTQRMQKLQGAQNTPASQVQGFGAAAAGQTQQSLGGFGRDSSVENIATRMMQDDSRLMRHAATEGRQYANKRGLLNSSIAAGASQDAALKYVTPFAQQEAAQNFQSGLSAQEFGQQSELSRQGFKQQGELSKQEFGQTSKLSQQEFGQQGKLSQQEAEQQARLQRERAGFEMNLAKLDANTRKDLLDREAAMRTSLQDNELTASAREQMSGMFTNMNDQYQKSVNSILANPDLPASERNRLLKTAGELLQSQVDATKSIFKMDFNWLDAAFNPNTGTKKPKSGGGNSGGNKGGTGGKGSTKTPVKEYGAPHGR